MIRTIRRAVLLLGLTALGLWAGVALAAPGNLDTEFNGSGKRTVDYGGTDSANAVAVQPDGKLVTVGEGGAQKDIQVTRLNRDGSLDASFGTAGTTAINSVEVDAGRGVALQPDGKIVIAGSSEHGIIATVVRLNADGSLDTTFGTGGIVTSGNSVTENAWAAAAVQPDGKIVLVGGGNTANPATPNLKFKVARLNPDGSPDASFAGGSVGIDFGGTDRGLAVALQPDGKIVAAGSTSDGQNGAVARLNPNGSLDSSFDGDGRRTLDQGGTDLISAVLLQDDGAIITAGGGGPQSDFEVSRLRPDGSTDPSFAGDGTIGVDFGAFDSGAAAALQPDGKVLVGGLAHFSFTTPSDMGLVRLQPNGLPDSTFGTDGKTTVDFGPVDAVRGLALQSDGKIVLAGSTGPTLTTSDVAVARLQGDPPSPGGGGTGGGGTGGGPGGGGGGPGGGGAGRPLTCGGKRATIVGTSRRDVLRGTRQGDVIVALGGNDRVLGSSGNDVVCGGDGNDVLAGDSGNDRLLGEGGRDTLVGAAGKDRLDGGSGNDALRGGAGADRLLGAKGDDRLDGGSGNDDLRGSAGADRLLGGKGNDRLDGGTGVDRLDGQKGRDNCLGGAGRDRAVCERRRGI